MNTLTISKNIIVCTLYASANFAAALLFFSRHILHRSRFRDPAAFPRQGAVVYASEQAIFTRPPVRCVKYMDFPPAHFFGKCQEENGRRQKNDTFFQTTACNDSLKRVKYIRLFIGKAVERRRRKTKRACTGRDGSQSRLWVSPAASRVIFLYWNFFLQAG